MTNRVVRLVFKERLRVSARLLLTTVLKSALISRLKFSRILSKTTTVLLTL